MYTWYMCVLGWQTLCKISSSIGASQHLGSIHVALHTSIYYTSVLEEFTLTRSLHYNVEGSIISYYNVITSFVSLHSFTEDIPGLQ